MRQLPKLPRLCALAAGAAALALAGSALAQTTVEELTVVGHEVKAPQETASYVVGFSDLNLRTAEGRKELRHRVSISATYVCHKLGDNQANAMAACRSKAIQDAMVKVRAIEHQVRAHGAHLTPGHPWAPPGA